MKFFDAAVGKHPMSMLRSLYWPGMQFGFPQQLSDTVEVISICCCWMQWHWDPLSKKVECVPCRLTWTFAQLGQWIPHFPLPLVGLEWSVKSQTTFCPKHCRFLYKNHLLHFRLFVFLAAASGERKQLVSKPILPLKGNLWPYLCTFYSVSRLLVLLSFPGW